MIRPPAELSDAECDAAIEAAMKAWPDRYDITFAEIDRKILRAGYALALAAPAPEIPLDMGKALRRSAREVAHGVAPAAPDALVAELRRYASYADKSHIFHRAADAIESLQSQLAAYRGQT